MRTKDCPVCGVRVKVENLDRHLRNQHPRAQVDRRAVLTGEEKVAVRESKATERPAMTARGKRIVAITTIVIAALLATAILFPRGETAPTGVAPDFTLPASTGGSITLSNFRGFVVLLEFMDVDCGYCAQEASEVLQYLYRDYGIAHGGQVHFLSVSVNFVGLEDTMDRINAFRTTHNADWTYVLDVSKTVAPRYGVSGTPTTFILDRMGRIQATIQGRAPGGYATYASALDALL